MELRLLCSRMIRNHFILKGKNCDWFVKLFPNGIMQWDNDIEQSIRDKYLVLTAGRYEIHRSSQVSQPSGDNGARYFAPADIESFHATEVQDTLRVLAKNACINIDIHLVSAANKLSLTKFDLICFSEPRCKDQDIFIDGKHRLI